MDLKNDAGLLGKDTNDVALDRSLVKIIILGVLGVAFSFLSGFFLQVFMLKGGSANLLYFSLAGFGFLSIFLLCVFFIKTGWIINIITLLEGIAFFALFYDRFSNMVGVGIVLGLLFFISGIYAGRNELENSLEIKFWKISKKILPKAIAGIAIFAGVISASFIDINSKEFFISRQAFNAIVSPITDNGLIQGLIPGIDVSGSAETTIKSIVAQEMQNNPQLKNLPIEVKKQLENQAVQEIKKKTADAAGVPVNLGNKLSDTLYDFMVVKFYSLPENIISSAPALVAIFIFLTIISLVWPIRLAAAALSFLIYEILLALGFGAIIFEGRSKESVILK